MSPAVRRCSVAVAGLVLGLMGSPAALRADDDPSQAQIKDLG
jgi:hypothetical protein